MNTKLEDIIKSPSFLALGLAIMLGLIMMVYAYLNTSLSNTTDMIVLFAGMGIIFVSLTTINKMLDAK